MMLMDHLMGQSTPPTSSVGRPVELFAIYLGPLFCRYLSSIILLGLPVSSMSLQTSCQASKGVCLA